MVPAAFIALPAFPLTPNGKIDRNALPEPDALGGDQQAYVPPQGPVETAIAAVWAEVLGCERIGREDNFFALGGHSLLAISVIERLRRQGWTLEVRALFLEPTLAGLAATIAGEDDALAADNSAAIAAALATTIPEDCTAITPAMLPLVDLTPAQIARIAADVPGGDANIQDIYPLSPLQEGILFHHLLAGRGDPYLLRSLVAFDTRARLDAYAAALQAVVARHDILRTAIAWEGLDEPVQVVHRAARVPVEDVMLEDGVPQDGGSDVAARLSARFDPAHTRIDVRQAPLIRLFVTPDPVNGRWLALQLFHHLIMDHSTIEGLQREIAAQLRGHGQLLDTPVPFRNFVAQARLGLPAAQHDAYFTDLLADVEEPTAPFGLEDVMGDGTGVTEAHLAIPSELALALRAQARRLGVTPASVCHLAFAQVLARLSGREDVVFGTVLFGRMQGGEGIAQTLGLFINTLPVRIRLGEEAVLDAVRGAHGQLARLLRHEHASLVRAQRCSGVAAPAPLFTALLNYRHFAADQAAPDQIRDGQAPAAPTDGSDPWAGITFLEGQERTNYPFALSVNDMVDGFSLSAQVREHDPARVCAYMHRALALLVEALAHAPDAAVVDLDPVPQDERHRLVQDWNRTARAYPRARGVHQLFAEQSPSSPSSRPAPHTSPSIPHIPTSNWPSSSPIPKPRC
ncbi:condensation domain-containing protein [Novosphingobium sp. Leaf2]|uniref:condensation domain-containing protein n=1 Tax=Novosphingobium sp. Leaf2 TaxID=1735670 RepID=UPI0006F1F69D|nr:hypothetical protein ASE49_08065 [Novosphingobium sp. Leaf2]